MVGRGASQYDLNGSTGTDSLTVNWGDSTSRIEGRYRADPYYPVGEIKEAGTGFIVNFSAIERFSAVFGNADDIFTATGGILSLDGGDGTNSFRGDYSAETAAITFALDGAAGATSVLAGQGTALKNFAAVSIATGSGNDSLTGGERADTLSGGGGSNVLNGRGGDDQLVSAGGVDRVDGGTGVDSWTGNYGNGYAALTFRQDAGTGFTLSNGTTVANVENITLTTGAGRDTFLIGRGASSYDLTGGAGTDSATVDWSASTARIEGSFVSVSGSYIAGFVDLGVAGPRATLRSVERLNATLGSGDDLFIVDMATATIDGGGGSDLFVANFSGYSSSIYFAAATTAGATSTFIGQGTTITNFEAFSITLGAGDDRLTGGAFDDMFSTGFGNDVIDGGRGADAMLGGLGDDVYYVDQGGDVVTEREDAGEDAVISDISYTLGANVENLTLRGAAVSGAGNELANVLIGNDRANILSGFAGNDTLDGGLGADTMKGGDGDDIYRVDQAGDIVVEYRNGGLGGVDTVFSTISYVLGTELENLTLVGVQNLAGTGNGKANVLVGNDGDNALDGGAGNDTLAGGAGNDSYYVGQSGDVVIEAADAGVDTVFSDVSHALRANVENLTLRGTATVATGNEMANVLIGNDRANTLSGLGGNDTLDGGLGADTMRGGDGNDRYLVDQAGDIVVEYRNGGLGGVDTVVSQVSYTLGANIEHLILAGTGALTATGNSLANDIVGNAGDNRIDGGAGRDRLTGGGGNDIFVFVTGAEAQGDRVLDFSAGDLIDLSQIDARADLAGNDGFTLITGSFTKQAGQLRVQIVDGAQLVSGDTDGNGVADFGFYVEGDRVLTAGDFIL